MFLELKSERGRLTDSQVDWLNALTGQKEPVEHWRSRDDIPDGYAFHPVGGWTGVWAAGDWQILVAVVRPRHKEWVLEVFEMTDKKLTPRVGDRVLTPGLTGTYIGMGHR